MGMNRRSFFKKAASGAAVLAIVPTVLSEPFMPKPEILGEYFDYTNFSHAALMADQELMVQQAAEELGYRAAMEINKLWETTYA
jgi:hypothetical protein